MTAKKTAKPATKTQKLAAAKRADLSAKRVENMTPAERRALLREYDIQTVKTAPTMEAASSDLLALLQAVGAEFLQKYYPDATMATFHATSYDTSGRPDYSVMIPMATAKKE